MFCGIFGRTFDGFIDEVRTEQNKFIKIIFIKEWFVRFRYKNNRIQIKLTDLQTPSSICALISSKNKRKLGMINFIRKLNFQFIEFKE